VHVLKREGVEHESVVKNLKTAMKTFVSLPVEERAELRRKAGATAASTDWSNFFSHYLQAHEQAAAAGEARLKKLPMERLSLPSIPTEGSAQIELPTEKGAHYKRTFHVINAVPEPLAPLLDLASNLWWRWHPDAAELFEELDPELWVKLDQNPHALLDRVDPDRLNALADQSQYTSRLTRVHAQMRQETETQNPRIAYFCMEYGIASFLKLYSGGLGILAGDHLKAASDLNLPLCAVGLAYKDGYFHQLVDRTGHQADSDDTNDFHSPPFERVMLGRYAPLKLQVPMPTGLVTVQAWKLRVGRISLYLLDTDVPENRPEHRAITNHLYGGDSAHRLRQEMILGLGGHQLLSELDIEPDVFHMNEGHSAFLIFARAARLIQRYGLRSQEAFEFIRNTTVFTTHTPVAAGHDRFPEDMVRPYLSRLERELHLDWPHILAMGYAADGAPVREFDTTALAARASNYVNGVSLKHGEVSREMFLPFYPCLDDPADVPCTSVTNGVHVPSWLAPQWQRMVEREMGPDWRARIDDADAWQWLRGHDAKEVWAIHRELRAEFVQWLEEHLTESWTRRREDLGLLYDTIEYLHSDRMIVGFARRFAPYKRADLLLSEPERLAKLLDSNPGVILVYAGKAHPADGMGQGLLRRVYEASKDPRLAGRVIFVENYDIDSARRLVAGCDVWLNTPTRPLEASGTSGMKAAMNGCLNLSVDDGWWREGYEGDNGWLIDLPGSSLHDPSASDRATTMALLEGEILPAYAERNVDGVPLAWVERMKASMASIIPRFSSRRMLTEYADRFYEMAMLDAEQLRQHNYRPLFTLAEIREHIRSHWDDIALESVHFVGLRSDEEVRVGASVTAEVVLRHPGLDARELEVQAVVSFGSRAHDRARRIVIPFHSDGGESHSQWAGTFTAQASGAHELRFRVRPKDRADGRAAALGLHLQKWL
jgi:phosphorylase/glycogen(starch) synthase